MNAIDNTDRHAWWWMAEESDNRSIAPGNGDRPWRGQLLIEESASPGSVLEAAFQIAMLPFRQIHTAREVANSNPMTPSGMPRAGNGKPIVQDPSRPERE